MTPDQLENLENIARCARKGKRLEEEDRIGEHGYIEPARPQLDIFTHILNLVELIKKNNAKPSSTS